MKYQKDQRVKVKTAHGKVVYGFIKMASHELAPNHPFKARETDYLVHYTDYEGFIVELYINEKELDEFQLIEG